MSNLAINLYYPETFWYVEDTYCHHCSIFLEPIIYQAKGMNAQTKQVAFMQLYQPVHERLSRFVQTLVWNTDDAKDVISETVLVAFEKFETIQEPEKFLYYLFGIAANVVRKKHRRKKFWGIFSEEQAAQIPTNQLADERLLQKELYTALQKLNDKQREAIVLFEITGFSIKEIAAMQNLSESGVKSNLKRGKEKLAKLLTDEPYKKTAEYFAERSVYGK